MPRSTDEIILHHFSLCMGKDSSLWRLRQTVFARRHDYVHICNGYNLLVEKNCHLTRPFPNAVVK